MTRTEFLTAFYTTRTRDFTLEDLHGIDLDWCRGAWCDFSGANFTSSAMRNFGGPCAIFHNAVLNGANLSRAKLWRCDLRTAFFSAATLIDTDLRHSDLRGADLSGAWIEDSDFTGALRLIGDDEIDGWDLSLTVAPEFEIPVDWDDTMGTLVRA
jgi:uncharacterized protein YjbI with pentapeptide repeats